jgi:putative transposase
MNRPSNVKDQLTVSPKSTLSRRVSNADSYQRDKARYGKRVADFRQNINNRVRSTRLLERVEIDHTKLDLVIVDEKAKQPIGRPWLTLDICPFTKLVVGFHLSPTNEQGAEV